MPNVTRLVTLAEVRDDSDGDRLSVSARHEAVLDDGRRVLLLDDRGWAQSPGGGHVEDVAETARVVVGPDEAFGDRSQDDMDSDHWNALAGTLRAHGVVADAGELKRLPHDVILSDALLAHLRGTA